jgi:hypothetical protein
MIFVSFSSFQSIVHDEMRRSGMRRSVSLYIVLRIRFGDLGISDILKLQNCHLRHSRLPSSRRAFALFEEIQVCFLDAVKAKSFHNSHFSLEPFDTQYSCLREYKRSLCIIETICKIKWMFFLCRSHRDTKEYIMTEFFQYQDGSLEIFIFPILFESDILTDTTPPDFTFTKEFRFSF